MTARIESGWELAAAAASLEINVGAAGVDTVSNAAGKFCHTDLSSVANVTHSDWATELKTRLDAATTSAQTYTVTWDGSAQTYTISASSTFTIEFPNSAAGTLMKQILGFAGDRTTATSHVSDVRPYYVIVAENGGWSEASDDYEPPDVSYGAVSDSGRIYAVGRTEAPILNDWVVPLEPKAAVFDRVATAAVPWTWSHFFQHARSVQPFARIDDYDSSVHRLRPEGIASSFKPDRVVRDWDELWNVRIQSYNLGYL